MNEWAKNLIKLLEHWTSEEQSQFDQASDFAWPDLDMLNQTDLNVSYNGYEVEDAAFDLEYGDDDGWEWYYEI